MKTFKTEIYVWSAIGSTPLTHREGAYCDVLVLTELECDSPADARATVEDIIARQPHGAYGHFSMPSHPNQNIRNAFVSPRIRVEV